MCSKTCVSVGREMNQFEFSAPNSDINPETLQLNLSKFAAQATITLRILQEQIVVYLIQMLTVKFKTFFLLKMFKSVEISDS